MPDVKICRVRGCRRGSFGFSGFNSHTGAGNRSGDTSSPFIPDAADPERGGR